MAERSVILDDRSPQITYTGNWKLGGVSAEYNSTTHGTWSAGAQATIAFTGTSIAVHGTIGRELSEGDQEFSPVTTYELDGNSGSLFTFVGTPSKEILYRQRFYSSPKLANRRHSLVVTLVTQDKNVYWIDYAKVAQPGEMSKGLIAAVVSGSVVSFLLIIFIAIAWRILSLRRRDRLAERLVGGESQPSFWPWCSRSSGMLVPFGSNALPESMSPDGEVCTSGSMSQSHGSEFQPQQHRDGSSPGSEFRPGFGAEYPYRSGYITQGGTYMEKLGAGIPARSMSSSSSGGSSTRRGITVDTNVAVSTWHSRSMDNSTLYTPLSSTTLDTSVGTRNKIAVSRSSTTRSNGGRSVQHSSRTGTSVTRSLTTHRSEDWRGETDPPAYTDAHPSCAEF